jgi:uncharacterized membrane protein
MFVWMLIFWGGLGLLAIWALSALFGAARPGVSPTTRSPQDIAKERYARGDISREEFTEIVQSLKELNQ